MIQVAQNGEEDLAELRELLRTAGVAVVGELVQHRDQPNSEHLPGARASSTSSRRAVKASRRQPRRLRRRAPARARSATWRSALGVPVIDRTAMILDIFADHAHTRRGQAPGRARPARVQPRPHARAVDAPRAPRRRALDGGIGTRGPGESQIETDRRLARDRISALRRRLRRRQAPRARRCAPSASARTCRSRARRLHERRQVDAAQRAHRRRGRRRATASSTRSTRRRATLASTAAPTC